MIDGTSIIEAAAASVSTSIIVAGGVVRWSDKWISRKVIDEVRKQLVGPMQDLRADIADNMTRITETLDRLSKETIDNAFTIARMQGYAEGRKDAQGSVIATAAELAEPLHRGRPT
jgi:hypothetical protein